LKGKKKKEEEENSSIFGLIVFFRLLAISGTASHEKRASDFFRHF